MSRRLAAVAVVVALVVAGCASGDPKPTTYISDTGATLNGDVRSSFVGDTEFWWRYGETTAYGSETPHRSVAIADSEPHPVSQPISGLTAGTTYHHQFCVSDEEEDPARVVCNTDRTFTTGPAGGRSGIAFFHVRGAGHDVLVMDPDGSDQVNLSTASAISDFEPAFSPDGRQFAFVSSPAGWTRIFVMLADGSDRLGITDHASVADDHEPAWSPDGSKIAFTSYDGADAEIYVMDPDGSNQTNLTNNPASDQISAWSPDGHKIAFTTNRDGNQEIYVMDADGDNPIRLTDDSSQDIFPAWSPDGSKIAFGSSRDGDFEIYVMNADGRNQVPLTDNPADDFDPAWSPDGSKIAFSSTRDGNQEIYAMDPDGSNQTNLTNNPGQADAGPAWSPRPTPVE